MTFCRSIDEFLPRSSEDKTINANGRKLLDFCRKNELRICNGRLGDDRNIGKFTFTGSSGRSVVDYVITIPSMFDAIKKFRVCEPNILSDHCVLEFSLFRNINIYTMQREETEPSERQHKKCAWDDVKKDQFMFNVNGVENQFLDLTENVTQARESVDTDRNIDSFLNVMENVCDPLFAKKINVPKEGLNDLKYINKQNRPWSMKNARRCETGFMEN